VKHAVIGERLCVATIEIKGRIYVAHRSIAGEVEVLEIELKCHEVKHRWRVDLRPAFCTFPFELVVAREKIYVIARGGTNVGVFGQRGDCGEWQLLARTSLNANMLPHVAALVV